MEHQTSDYRLIRHFYADGVEITEQLANALMEFNRTRQSRVERSPVLITEEENPRFDGDMYIWAAAVKAVEEQEVLDNLDYVFTRDRSPFD